MAKIAIVYKSKKGSTKQYAEWIAEETGADLFDASACKGKDLAGYDTIVFGGWIRAGGIQGIEFLRKNMRKFRGKEVIAFAVGISLDTVEVRQECRAINFKRRLKGVPCYFLRGAYDPTGLQGVDKAIMRLVEKMVDDSNPKLKDAITNGADYVDRKEIQYIVEALKGETE